MYCAFEGFGRIDDTFTAYCIKHGRSPHKVREKKQEETCEKCGYTQDMHGGMESCKEFVAKNELVPTELIDNLVKKFKKPKNHSPLNRKKVRQPDTPSETAYEQAKAEGTLNLSKKIGIAKTRFENTIKTIECIQKKDVKEFIKQENILLNLLWKGKIRWSEFWKRRTKLAGEDLI